MSLYLSKQLASDLELLKVRWGVSRSAAIARAVSLALEEQEGVSS